MLCSEVPIRDTHKSPEIALLACRTQSVECSKLGKTRIIEDADIQSVRNATFFDPNVHLYFHLKSHGVIFL